MVCQRLQKFCGQAFSRQTLNDGNRNSSIQSGGGGGKNEGAWHGTREDSKGCIGYARLG